MQLVGLAGGGNCRNRRIFYSSVQAEPRQCTVFFFCFFCFFFPCVYGPRTRVAGAVLHNKFAEGKRYLRYGTK
jgi:hypothetical protein